MPVGDVNSTERGSGARYNDGKPDLSLIPPLLLPYSTDVQRRLHAALSELMFDGNPEPLKDWHYEAMRANADTCAKVFEYGKQKYAAWNWAKGMNWSVPVACTLRHARSLWTYGEADDRESNLPHIGHILCNTTMILHFVRFYDEGNDLPYKVLNANANN